MHEMSVIIKYEASENEEEAAAEAAEGGETGEESRATGRGTGMSLFNSCVGIFHSNIEFSTQI